MFRSTIDFLIFDFESACDLRTKTLSLVSTCHIYIWFVFSSFPVGNDISIVWMKLRFNGQITDILIMVIELSGVQFGLKSNA
jgi:hypothetical protein